MAGPAEAAGNKTTPVELAGRTYQIGRVKIGDLAALQTHLEELRERAVSGEEIIGEMSTPRGSLFLLWRILHRSENGLTLEDVHEMIDFDDEGTYAALMAAMGIAGEEGSNANPPK